MRTPPSFLAVTLIALTTAIGQEWTHTLVGTMPFSEVPTNVFLTDRSLGDTMFLLDSSGRVVVPTNAVAAALKAPESRPAQDDPEGHWGPIVAGWQISLRLSTNTYTPGQPVYGTVLLRNVTDKEVEYIYTGTPHEAFDTSWVNEDTKATNRIVPPPPEGLMSSHGVELHPRSQRRLEVQLEGPPKESGRFLVSASTKVYEQGKDIEVSSGGVPVTLLGPAVK